jgi:hypothetical protein
MKTTRVSAVLLFSLFSGYASTTLSDGHSVRADSQKHTVALLELYTSEGCSSCPPAEKYIQEVHKHRIGSDRLIPLAFHVNYWDYIGWKDPYANPAYSKRQKNYASVHRLSSVYTPQIILHGIDFRSRGNLEKAVKIVNDIPSKADMTISVEKLSNDILSTHVNVVIPDEDIRDTSVIYLALYENNLISQIHAGENEGRTLNHEFVVRDLVGPLPIGDKHAQISHQFIYNSNWKLKDLGVVAFIQNFGSKEPIQAVDVQLGSLSR